MSYTPSFGTIESTGEPIGAPKAESPFRIGFLADFSGRQNRGLTGDSSDIAARKMLRISRDTLDDVMAMLGVQLTVPVGDSGDQATLSFASLDDFHPDQVHDRVDYIVDLYDAGEKSAAMNSVLHHPDFQALESAWRGLAWLLSRAAKGKVEVAIIDISLAELAADLKASENLSESGLNRLLIEKGVRGPQGEPWAMFVGDYSFDLSGEHAELLGRIAKIVAQTSAPFLTTVNRQVLDKSFKLADDAAPAWQALRELPETVFLGLAVPRFLLRLPYGENTTSIDKFSYEEMPGTPDKSHYLWGNPALGCAALVAHAFHKAGWGCDPGTDLALEDLPIHIYTVDGDQEVTLAEAWLARPQTEQLVKLGIMPLLCVRGKGAMQLLRLLSVAQPPAEHLACDLWGRWIESGVAPAPTVARLAGGAKVGMVGEVVKPRPGSSAAPAAAPAAAAPRPKVGPAGTVSAPPAAPPPAPTPPPVVQEPEPEPEPEETVAAETTEATTEAAETPAAEAPAEEEMDPELAALLKQLE